LSGAQQQLERMQQYFLVQDFELKPQVYVKITTNWVGLTLRYVVDPRKRRAAATFLNSKVFESIGQRKDITIGTDTMEVTYKRAEAEKRNDREQRDSHPTEHDRAA
jgi:hypothetical protein